MLECYVIWSAGFVFLTICTNACVTALAGNTSWIGFTSQIPGPAMNLARCDLSDKCLGTRQLPNGKIQVQYGTTTSTLEFNDDIDLLINPLEEGSSELAAYSRSSFGLHDFEANRARLDKLFEHLWSNPDRLS